VGPVPHSDGCDGLGLGGQFPPCVAGSVDNGVVRDRIRYFCRFSLLIVDEIGYLPVTPGGGNLFFQLVNARCEKAP
jgi:DNA replication protein DnaC